MSQLRSAAGGSHETHNAKPTWATAEMASCDAQHLGPLTVSNRAHVGANTVRAAQDVRQRCGLTFRHADGSVYGRVIAPVVADARAKAFLALRCLGFRESEV